MMCNYLKVFSLCIFFKICIYAVKLLKALG